MMQASINLIKSVDRWLQGYDESFYRDYSEQSLKERRFYNIGAGAFYHPYWTNVDHGTIHYRDAQKTPFIEYDLTSGKHLPIDDNAAEALYISHVLEHVPDDAAERVFRDARDALMPGGVIRVTSPNILLYYDAMRRGDLHFWYMAEKYYLNGYFKVKPGCATLPQLFLFEFATQLSTLATQQGEKVSDDTIQGIFSSGPTDEAFNYFTHKCAYSEDFSGYHINWWTPEKATRLLREAGFKQVYPSAYGQSKCPPLRDLTLFDGTHPKLSFYVEAIK